MALAINAFGPGLDGVKYNLGTPIYDDAIMRAARQKASAPIYDDAILRAARTRDIPASAVVYDDGILRAQRVLSFDGAPEPVSSTKLTFGTPPYVDVNGGFLDRIADVFTPKSGSQNYGGSDYGFGTNYAPQTRPASETYQVAVDGQTPVLGALKDLASNVLGAIGAGPSQPEYTQASYGGGSGGSNVATIAMVLAAAGVAYLLVKK